MADTGTGSNLVQYGVWLSWSAESCNGDCVFDCICRGAASQGLKSINFPFDGPFRLMDFPLSGHGNGRHRDRKRSHLLDALTTDTGPFNPRSSSSFPANENRLRTSPHDDESGASHK